MTLNLLLTNILRTIQQLIERKHCKSLKKKKLQYFNMKSEKCDINQTLRTINTNKINLITNDQFNIKYK